MPALWIPFYARVAAGSFAGDPTPEVTSVDYPIVLDVAGSEVRCVVWVVVPFLGDIG